MDDLCKYYSLPRVELSNCLRTTCDRLASGKNINKQYMALYYEHSAKDVPARR